MTSSVLEASYPINFRKEETGELGEYLRHRHSLELVGLKRVGISDFLRFFLYRRGIVEKYIYKQEKHLFIPVDLNDLVERETFPFWVLTFKRLVDAIENFPMESKAKRDINNLFLDSIQSRDLFLAVENIRGAFLKILENKILPTVFLIRFDRIIESIDDQFFSNLEGLIDATGHRLSYVFTSFRKLSEISKVKLPRNFLQIFQNIIYVKPAAFSDTKTIFKTFKKRYKLSVNRKLTKRIIELSGGHVQYLHLLTVILMQKFRGQKIKADNLLEMLKDDERINLQSEEIWESLNEKERAVLLKVHRKERVSGIEKRETKYLWETGLVYDSGGETVIFSPLFGSFLEITSGERKREAPVEFTRKENKLFNFLLENVGRVCERERIIEAVWPESEDFGVSDWTIDRLIARVRTKLSAKGNRYSIITIKTRGFKLIKDSP